MRIDIKRLRERTDKYSQAQAADHIGVSQAQMSRYEADPENVPFGTLNALLDLYGVDIATALAAGRDDDPLDLGDPYAHLDRKLDLLADYAAEFDAVAPDPATLPDGPYGLGDLRTDVARLRRRPVVALVGLFDAGKSRVANALLGGRRLPEDFTPTTATLTVVRHADERPQGTLEDVVLLRESFWPADDHGDLDLDPRYLDDPDRIAEHRLVQGSYDVLRQHGVHHTADGHETQSVDAHTALVYVDAPVLRACTVLDLPGFGDKPEGVSEDVRRANAAVRLADVAVYCSGARGFMNSADLLHLGNLLRLLPQPDARDAAFPTLGNLLVLATHASPTAVRDDQLGKILALGAKRVAQHLGETVLPQRADAAGRPIGQAEVAARIFPFWAESQDRTRAFEDDLRTLLTVELPRVRALEVSAQVEAIKASAAETYRDQAARVQTLIDEIDQVETELAQQEAAADERQATFRRARAEVRDAVSAAHDQTVHAFRQACDDLLTLDAIERTVRERYPDKNEAKEFAPAYFTEQLQDRLERAIKPQAQGVEAVINAYLDDVGVASFGGRFEHGAVDLPFDVRGAFAGGLAGLTAWGGLAFWAAGLGNLGYYILAAKAVSLLSAIGISVGGTAGVMTFLAAIGGPITLVVGLATVFGLGAWRLFGETWQSRLAKKIEKQFREQGVRDQFEGGIARFWDDTRRAFDHGADAFEARYDAYLQQLRDIVADRADARHTLEQRLQAAHALRDFFAGLPWVPLAPGGDGASAPR